MLGKLPRTVGHALAGIRPGLDKIASYGPGLAEIADTIVLTSPAFAPEGAIPVRFTEDGEGVSPPLAWQGVPDAAQSVVILVEDADSPTPAPLVHAIVWDLPGRDGEVPDAALPTDGWPDDEPPMGKNSFYAAEYLPPDPPPGHGRHHYAFQVFALDTRLDFETVPGRSALLAAMRGRVLARGLLIGTYERS